MNHRLGNLTKIFVFSNLDHLNFIFDNYHHHCLESDGASFIVEEDEFRALQQPWLDQVMVMVMVAVIMVRVVVVAIISYASSYCTMYIAEY